MTDVPAPVQAAEGRRERPAHYTEIDLGMSNFDHSIDDGLEDALQREPVFCRHSAWEFNGQVWWDGSQFREQVWRYHAPIATYAEDTLRELMETVNDNHGWE